MTREEAIAHGKEQLEVFGGEHREFIEMAIKALEQEPTIVINGCDMSANNVGVMPPVTPSRRKGHWISHILSIECSECKQKFFADDENENCQDYDACEDFGFKFCPNCGAEMESEE